MKSQQYVPVRIKDIRNLPRNVGVDFYLKLSENNFAHVFSKTTGIDYERLAQYLKKGVEDLYVTPDDYAAMDAYFSGPQGKEILSDPRVPTEKKVAYLMDMTDQALSEITVLTQVSGETGERVRNVVQGYVRSMASSPTSLQTLVKLAQHGDYLYYHSVLVSVLSLFLAKTYGIDDQETLETIAFGAFLHDVGYTRLGEDYLYPVEDLIGPQLEVQKTHVQLGLEMLEVADNIPKEVRYIVYQHHENAQGTGYPSRLKGEVAFLPAQIVSIADAFSVLISPPAGRKAYSPKEAVSYLRRQGLNWKPTLLDALEEMVKRSTARTPQAA